MPTEDKKQKKPLASANLTLNKQEMITISNLLYSGNFGLSAKDFDAAVKPIINKLAVMIDRLDKKS